MGNRYDDERYGRGPRPEEDRGYGSEHRRQRDWGHEMGAEAPGSRDLRAREGHARELEDQRSWQQPSRTPWPDYALHGQVGYEGNRPRPQTRLEPRGGYERARDDEQHRYSESQRGYPQGRRWQGAMGSQSAYGRGIREELDRGRFVADQESGMPRDGHDRSGEYSTGGHSRWSGPGTPDYPGYAGLYSGYGGYGEPGDARRDWRSRERDTEPWQAPQEGWQADRARWRGGASEREAPFGERSEERPAHHRGGIAGAIDAIRGEIRDAFRGLKGYKRSDERIREDVCDRINELSEVHGMDVGDVEVTVANGEVMLTGSIDNRQFKHRIENEAAGISGVGDVHNEIRVRRSSLDFEGRSRPSTNANPRSPSVPAQTATATAGALSSGMIGMSGVPGATEKPRTPNGNPQANR